MLALQNNILLNPILFGVYRKQINGACTLLCVVFQVNRKGTYMQCQVYEAACCTLHALNVKTNMYDG